MKRAIFSASFLVFTIAISANGRTEPSATTTKAAAPPASPSSPSVRANMAKLHERVTDLDEHKRGLVAPIGPMLKGLGAETILPLLGVIALDPLEGADLTPSARLSLHVGLIEAAGSLRDPRAIASLAVFLDRNESQEVRAAAEALGHFGTDAIAATLVSRSTASRAQRLPILAGMGSCRRTSVAHALEKALAAHPAAPEAVTIVHSLGDIGSSWAWKTPSIDHKEEEASIRAVAASALISAFVSYEGEVRTAASNALMIVDDASTPSLIAAAKTKNPQLAPELETLARRFAANPVR
ncbi:MAG: hypothetical protein NVSMB1_04140 [Polyangiales bacterium]